MEPQAPPQCPPRGLPALARGSPCLCGELEENAGGRGFGRERTQKPPGIQLLPRVPGHWAQHCCPPPITPVPSLSYRPPRVGPGTSVASPACAQEKTQNKGFLTALPPPPSLGPEPQQEKGLPLLNQTLNSWEQEVKMTFTSHSRESRSCYFTDSHTHTHTHVPYKSRPRTSPVDPAPPEAPWGALLHVAAPLEGRLGSSERCPPVCFLVPQLATSQYQ